MDFEYIDRLDFKKMGLIPTITQDCNENKVLMLAYSNRASLTMTIETGYAHYWSRSRQKLWKKGETSGHTQKIIEVLVDCDEDALLFRVTQKGSACHTGHDTCFFRELEEL
jgi:phosphoribosyl-AMP cyclohydrolase